MSWMMTSLSHTRQRNSTRSRGNDIRPNRICHSGFDDQNQAIPKSHPTLWWNSQRMSRLRISTIVWIMLADLEYNCSNETTRILTNFQWNQHHLEAILLSQRMKIMMRWLMITMIATTLIRHRQTIRCASNGLFCWKIRFQLYWVFDNCLWWTE